MSFEYGECPLTGMRAKIYRSDFDFVECENWRMGGKFKAPKLDLIDNERNRKIAHYIAGRNIYRFIGHGDDDRDIDYKFSRDLIKKTSQETIPDINGRIDEFLIGFNKLAQGSLGFGLTLDKYNIHVDNGKEKFDAKMVLLLVALSYSTFEKTEGWNGKNDPLVGDFPELVDSMIEEFKFLKKKGGKYLIAKAGYERLRDLENSSKVSKQGFIAMWFDKKMDDVHKKISDAIRETKFTPLRIDGLQHNEDINDAIISQIRRSRFLVADFTSGTTLDDNKQAIARGGVYFEAGFAEGLNIPVVYTCRHDFLDKIHFDINHKNFITWEQGDKQLDDFKKKLIDRISATIFEK